MRKLLSHSLVIGLLCVAGAQQVEAQMTNPGIGGFLDWIHRLSGPRMFGASVSVFSPTWSSSGPGERPILRGRLTGAYRHSFSSDDKIDPDGSPVTMFSIQPMAEFHLVGNDNSIDIAIGAAFNRFGAV